MRSHADAPETSNLLDRPRLCLRLDIVTLKALEMDEHVADSRTLLLLGACQISRHDIQKKVRFPQAYIGYY